MPNTFDKKAESKDKKTGQVVLYKVSAGEKLKIKCVKVQFEEFEGMEYRVVSKVGELVNN